MKSVTGIVGGIMPHKEGIAFRIGEKIFRYEAFVPLNDGDSVTVVGDDNGEFTVWTLRNLTTQTDYGRAKKSDLLWPILVILFGLPFCVVIIGIPVVIKGLLWAGDVYFSAKATTILDRSSGAILSPVESL